MNLLHRLIPSSFSPSALDMPSIRIRVHVHAPTLSPKSPPAPTSPASACKSLKSRRSRISQPSPPDPPAPAPKPTITILTPAQAAHIAYFPASASSSPTLAMNTPVRSVRPGVPSSALSLDARALHTRESLSMPALGMGTGTGTDMGEIPESAFTPPFNIITQSIDSAAHPLPSIHPLGPARPPRTLVALRKLRARARQLLPATLKEHQRKRRADTEQEFQDAAHATYACWRCRRAGGRREGCRAFRRAGEGAGRAGDLFA
ncbi:uncharacterized protein LAESUDRAFT_282374 [Laetiporus sulphureus 93-53]|uniref:Uncharacterized protein n=1 Tax=Laetiporus sulphureus 93-53 TaxID=1314785 RepID=A0A165DF15_9APHY|nr:uncharacterized protein LAESUDRAFT_282374 [Laetiporus sulphureus 93-53]KZT04747.1 hypothetical protein LAESUDRAFT_282374 [Laetiporus sulphureus 93-53]